MASDKKTNFLQNKQKSIWKLHKKDEISDEELDNVAGGGCFDSDDKPKFHVGQKVWKAASRRHYPVTIVSVSSEKKDCGAIITSNVFTYSV